MNRTPAVLFTYNGAFAPNESNIQKKALRAEELADRLRLYNIDAKRVVYIVKERDESRVYASESFDLLKTFFKIYR